MVNERFRRGEFHSLGREEVPDLVAHWKRLSEDSLRRRFLRPMRPADLEAHARDVFRPGAEAIGWFRAGVLRGVAELYLDRRGGEAAFSVEAEFRGQGIGKRLMSHALRRARNRGCRSLMIMTTRDNAAMIRIARLGGARFEYDGSEVIGHFDLAPADVGTHLADITEEEASFLSGAMGRIGRMAAAWLPGSGGALGGAR